MMTVMTSGWVMLKLMLTLLDNKMTVPIDWDYQLIHLRRILQFLKQTQSTQIDIGNYGVRVRACPDDAVTLYGVSQPKLV